jgi:WD40 repeat protein
MALTLLLLSPLVTLTATSSRFSDGADTSEPKEVLSPEELQRFPSEGGEIWSVAFSPDGHRALSAGGKWLREAPVDCVTRLWDLESGKLIRKFEGNTSPLTGVAFAADGHRFLSVGLDATMTLWDVDRGKELRTLRHDIPFRSGAYSPDGRQALTGDDNGNVILWDARTGKALRWFQGHSTRTCVFSVAFSPDGRSILSGGMDQTIRL